VVFYGISPVVHGEAKIKHKGHTTYLGLFRDEAAAARAYDKAAYDLHGLAAKLNFPRAESEEDNNNDEQESEKDQHSNVKSQPPDRSTRESLRQMSKEGNSRKEDTSSDVLRSPRGRAPSSSSSLIRGQKRSSESLDEGRQKYARRSQRQDQSSEEAHLKERSKVRVSRPGPFSESSNKMQRGYSNSKESLLNLDALKVMIMNVVEKTSVTSKEAKEKLKSNQGSRGHSSSLSSTSIGKVADSGGSEDTRKEELSTLKKEIEVATQGCISVPFAVFLQTLHDQIDREVISFLSEINLTFQGKPESPQDSSSSETD